MSLLQKNLECIKHYYDISVFDSVDDSDVELVLSPEPNLSLNGQLLHDKTNPLAEAMGIIEKVENSSRTNLILFGIGLGYLFQLTAQKSKGLVILFEQDLRILKKAFSLVDFSAELSKKKVFVVSDMNLFETIFKSNFKYQSTSFCLSLPNYKLVNWEYSIDSFVKTVSEIAGYQFMDFNYLKSTAYLDLKNSYANLPKICKLNRISDYVDLYKGKTALIVSAGPTLDENLEIIKANRDKFIVFVVGTACRVLMQNGVKPDYLVILESHNCSSQLEGLDLSDIEIILESHTNPVFYNLKSKNKIVYMSESFLVNKALCSVTGGVSNEPDVRGTVSYMALLSAKLMGFSKFVLVGQDLAYVDGRCYSKNAVYSDLYFEINEETQRPEVRARDLYSYAKSLRVDFEKYSKDELLSSAQKWIDGINKTLLFVDGINGEKLVTTVGYSQFITGFEQFVKTYQDLEYINTSMKGALISGFKNIPLKDVVANLTHITKLYPKVSTSACDFEFIKSNLKREISFLKSYIEYIEPIMTKRPKIEGLKRNRQLTTADGLIQVRNLVKLYDSDEIRNKLISAEVVNFSMNLDVQLALDSTNFTNEKDIATLCDTLFTYFNTIQIRAKELIILLEGVYESINSKS